jgi:ribonuclease HI
MIKIYVDGGTVGTRICLVDKLKDKTIVKTRGVNPTNNELEYLALLYALEYIANNYKKRNITIYSDSMLIVNQINGKWRVTTPKLTPLWNKCMKLVTDKMKIKWVSRDFNEAGWVLDSLLGK